MKVIIDTIRSAEIVEKTVSHYFQHFRIRKITIVNWGIQGTTNYIRQQHLRTVVSNRYIRMQLKTAWEVPKKHDLQAEK